MTISLDEALRALVTHKDELSARLNLANVAQTEIVELTTGTTRLRVTAFGLSARVDIAAHLDEPPSIYDEKYNAAHTHAIRALESRALATMLDLAKNALAHPRPARVIIWVVNTYNIGVIVADEDDDPIDPESQTLTRYFGIDSAEDIFTAAKYAAYLSTAYRVPIWNQLDARALQLHLERPDQTITIDDIMGVMTSPAEENWPEDEDEE